MQNSGLFAQKLKQANILFIQGDFSESLCLIQARDPTAQAIQPIIGTLKHTNTLETR